MSRLDLTSLTRLAANLRALPVTLGQRVAAKAAPVISELAQESFDQSVDPYGAPWAPAADGSTVSLRKTGDLEKFVRYVAIGTRLRVALGVPYAKYQIGRRPIFPRAGLLPAKYSQALAETAAGEVRAILGEGGG